MFPNRLRTTAVLLVATAVLTGCGGGAGGGAVAPRSAAAGSSSAPAGGAATVDIANYTFAKPTVTVPAGSTVTWVNTDDFEHTARAKDRSFDTMKLAKGKSATVTFANAGTFAYICDIHQYMTGTVVVT